jgi:hypothetical protein
MGWTYEKRQGILLILAASYATAIGLKRSMHEANHSSLLTPRLKIGTYISLSFVLSLYAVVLNYVRKYLRFLLFILIKNREGNIQLRRLGIDYKMISEMELAMRP